MPNYRKIYESVFGKIPKLNLTKGICPFCKKEGQYVAMQRWHFNNCKQKEVAHA